MGLMLGSGKAMPAIYKNSFQFWYLVANLLLKKANLGVVEVQKLWKTLPQQGI
jgi:hypothetical protein